MNVPNVLTKILGLSLAICLSGVRAEDIDIFGQLPSNGANPNIMIILDNASAWDATATFNCPTPSAVLANNAGKDVGFEQCSLYEAINGIGNQTSLLGRLNIGLMMFGSNQNGGGVGGTITYPSAIPASLPTMDTNGINSFKTYIKSIDRQTDNANNSQVGGGMQEAYAFFFGKTGLSGRSYGGQTDVFCQRNFIIYIANALNNGKPQDSGQFAQDALATAITQANAPTSLNNIIDTSNLGQYTKYDAQTGDEWARFLYQTDFNASQQDKQNVITYTIAVTDGTNPDYVQSTVSMAKQGGGKSFVVNVGDVSGLVQALLQIFNEVQAVNSAFASASLPVSVNTQGTYLNQVYIGMFRPDGRSAPRWNGNLKQYQFGVDISDPTQPQLFLADKNGDHAISNAGTGFMTPTAVSFWTKDINLGTYPDSLGGFFVNNPSGSGGGYDTPDGEVVEKGGAAQQARIEDLFVDYAATPTSPRRLYTCTNGSGGLCAPNALLSASPFATTNTDLTQTAFGLSSVTNLNISSITRTTPSTSSTAGTAIVTLSSAPGTPLANNQSVTVSGFSDNQLNGTKTITLIGSTGLQFSYPITEYPSLNSTGNYTASVPAGAAQAVTSITRSGTTATVTMPTGGNGNAGGYQTGQQVQISGASDNAYNQLVTISTIGANTFTYPVTVTTNTTTNYPSTPANISGASASCKKGSTITSLGPINSIYLKSPTTTPSTRVVVRVQNALPAECTDNGTKGITVAGATDTVTSPSIYNVTDWTVGLGTTVAACDPTLPAGTNVICYNITPTTTSTTTPLSPATAASGQTIQATRVAAASSIASMSHLASTCGTTTPNVLVTATTTAAHAFVTGDQVTIASNSVPANEGAYVGTFTITKTSSTGFTFTITTTPTPTSITASCPLNISGVSISSSTNAISAANLINWVRGKDDIIKDELSPDTTYTHVNVRPSLHGDVLHSRPAIINYADDKIVAFYGSNDGVFRAVNANKTANIGSVPVKPGGELWGFIAPEFFTKFARLYSNSPSVLLKTTPTGIIPTPQTKDYFFDGNVGVYKSADSPPKVYIYLSARRGGRFIYAIDVSDPETPKFLWRRSNTDVTTDVRYGELGYTWSEPKVAVVQGWAHPVIIMGMGYDTNQDVEPPAGADTMGRGIIVLDALDGSIVWQATVGSSTNPNQCTAGTGSTTCTLSTMTYSIPADVALIDRHPRDGSIERAYTGDTGGNIWRIDFETDAGALASPAYNPSTWMVTKFASVGGTGTNKRKLLFPPDVIATRDFDVVLASTGDREHPLISHTQTFGVVNRFYSIKDQYNGIGSNASTPPSTYSPVTDSSDTTTNNPATGSGLFDCSGCASGNTFYDPTSLTNPNGFYFIFPNAGEKGVNKANSIGGFTYFGTNTPVDPNEFTCATGLGIARGYKINSFTGATLSTIFDGGGLPPSPVIGLVTVTFPGATTPSTVPFLIGGGIPGGTSGDSRSPFGGQIPTIAITGKRIRKYWNMEHDK